MESNNPRLGLGELLLVAFVVLKLCGVIDWSWWWVLSPAWIPGIGLLICHGLKRIIDKHK